MKTYTMSFAAASEHIPAHPGRTARKNGKGMNFDVTFGVFTNRAAMLKTIELQERRASRQDDWKACKLPAITTELDQFESMVRSICPVGGNAPEVNGTVDMSAPVADFGVRLGNVEFWIDADGPWAGKLSFSIPTSQWDKARVSADLAAKLRERAA